jgi:hypothetical protein
MCSSGIRLEAWIYLRWKHVETIEDKKTGEIIAAKLTVYDGTPQRYYTLITPEAYLALKNWMDHRAKHGEKITGESWLMRDLWRTVDVKMNNDESAYNDDADESNNKNGHGGGRGGPTGFAKYPKRLSYAGVKKILSRALSAQRIRTPLRKCERRYEWKASHGYRKFFETHAQEAMKLLYAEILMGDDTGLQRSYIKQLNSSF